MDRRTILAFVLMAIVLFAKPILFPTKQVAPTTPDTTHAAATTAPAPSAAAPNLPQVGAVAASPSAPIVRTSTVLATPRAELVLANPGAAPDTVRIPSYRDLSPRLARRDSTATLSAGNRPLLGYRLARGTDTIALDTIPFTVTSTATAVTFASAPITLSYEKTNDGFRTQVRGTVAGAPAGAALIIDLPSTLRSIEADTVDDMRHLAFSFKRPRRDVQSIAFSKLDSLETRVDTGGMQWVAVRNKYWLVALMQPVGAKEEASVFHGMTSRGGSYSGKVEREAHAVTAYPVQNGQISFDLYAGPQAWGELHGLGNDLENVNPYAGFMHVVVQPFATIVMRVLLWLKATFQVNYGWVLVLFGVLIRVVLWPLNQKAMRSSIQMQRLQPELTEVQKKYKAEPEKLREEMMKVYQRHGMSPLSPLLGCLPMLLPMPVLFALYFVFQNTIEFRGVPFLWLPDLSLRDPFFITPIVMGLSMFLLSWIGMRGVPPNPQTKMMSYMMPIMFTAMFFNFASGLNLYYAVQNIASLPQQWLVTRARAKAASTPVVKGTPTKRATPKKT